MVDLVSWLYATEVYNDAVLGKIVKSELAKSLCYGADVIDGHPLVKPKVLFVGINPRAGSKERHYTTRLCSEKMSYLDHLEGEYNYPLAKETCDVFRKVGLSDEQIVTLLEKDCIKTNFYNISTDSEKDLKPCITQAGIDFGEYFRESINLFVSLLKITKPKIVLVEGKGVWDNVVADEDIFNAGKEAWDSAKGCGYHYDSVKDIHFIGYARLYSNIKNKEAVADLLKEKVHHIIF